MAFLERNIATSAVIKSKPGDFFSVHFLIVCLTSFGMKYFSGIQEGGRRLRKLSTSFT